MKALTERDSIEVYLEYKDLKLTIREMALRYGYSKNELFAKIKEGVKMYKNTYISLKTD